MDPQVRQLLEAVLVGIADSNYTGARQIREFLATGQPITDPAALAAIRQAAQGRGIGLTLPGTDKIPGGRPQNAQGPGDAPGGEPPVSTTPPNSTDPNDGPAPTIPPGSVPPVNPGASPSASPLTPITPNYGGNSGIDPYVSAAQGEQQPLQTVMMNILDSLGIDYARPGIYTNEIIKQIQPYLPLYMMMMSGQTPGSAGARGAALEFRDMINSPNAFYRIQEWVNNPKNQELIANYIANAKNEDTAIGAINAAAAAASAGYSPMQQQTDSAILNQQFQHYISAGGNNPDLHYVDWLNKNRDALPRQLLPFLNAKPAVRPLTPTTR